MRLTEKEILKKLLSSAKQYQPLIFTGLEDIEFLSSREARADAIGQITIENGPGIKVLIECVSVATPKNITLKSKLLRDYLNKITEPEIIPLLIAPYISSKQAKILSNEGVSWIDLCGNMRVSVPGKIYIEKTGNKNRFPDTSPIKKIFEGTSVLVSRALLLKQEGFNSQYELVDYINNRNAKITAGTVSRVLKSLEEELLVQQDKSLIYAVNPGKLLDCLNEGYKKSTARKTQKTCKYTCENPQGAFSTLSKNNIDYLACGFYAAKIKGLAFTDMFSIFVKSIEETQNAFNRNNQEVEPDSEYGNIIVIETNEPGAWFNTEAGFKDPVVDDIELYLEMANDSPRGPKVAEVLKERILKTEANER
jgi:hypothetical protein